MEQGTTLSKNAAERIVAATYQVEDWQASGQGRSRKMVPLSRRAGAVERIGIVVAIGGPLDLFVQVVEPIFNDTDPWDGGWIIPAGEGHEPREVWCYPPSKAEDFQDYVLEGGPPGDVMVMTDDMDPLPVVKLYGVWFIKARPLFGYSPFPEGAQYSDCWENGGMP
jgi:hypothetical protein